MKIQIVSDLHLEFRGKDVSSILVPSAPILCMVGDICACGTKIDFDKFINFLRYYSVKFTVILHVAGNHEYYTNSNASSKDLINNTIPQIDKRLAALNKYFPNYHYLNNSTWTYENTRTKHKYVFVGTTLWTFIPKKVVSINGTKTITDKKSANKKSQIELAELVEKSMNDYYHIYVPYRVKGKPSYRNYTVSDMQKKHKAAVSFVKKIISSAKHHSPIEYTYVLLTHHKPLFDRSTDEQDEFTYAYESDLADVLLVPPFSVAAHGHTHIHYDKRVNNIRVVSNPKGYIGETTHYNDKFTVNI
jgi:predicted phosphodiesterase